MARHPDAATTARHPAAWRLLLAGFLVLCLMPISASPPAAAQAGGTGVEYAIFIACPQGRGSISTNSPGVGCPIRAVDEQDEMGDPSIAVDPSDPNNLVIASLHGGSYGATGINFCNGRGPTTKSRCGQDFTTFTSRDGGASWTDNPFLPPGKVGESAFGETTAITINPYGQVFVGSLYAEPGGKTGFRYILAAQKFSDLSNINSHQDGEYHAEFLGPVYNDSAISQLWFLFDPAQDNMTLVWSEHLAKPIAPPPCNADPDAVEAAGYYVKTDGTAWEESNNMAGLQTPVTCPPPGVTDTQRAAAGHATSGGSAIASAPRRATAAAAGNTSQPLEPGTPRSVIGVAWTGLEVNDTYRYQSRDEAIGPCSSSTNPVLSDGYLYVGCVVAPEEGQFRWDPTAVPGTVELFRMDPSGGKPQYLGASPIVGGNARLGVRSDGRLALLSTQATTDGQLRFLAAFGHYTEDRHGIDWNPLTSYGDKILPVNPSFRVTDANVQDLIYREYSGVVHLILKTRIQSSGTSVGVPKTALSPHLHKTIIALDENYGVLYKHDMDIGNIGNRTSDPDLMQAPEAAYDDTKDDFLQLPEGNFNFTEPGGKKDELSLHYQREFFAIGDYGQVQFAELVEVTNLRGPAFAAGQGPPPPIPAAATSSTATGVLLPAAGITTAALIAGAFFANRRKDLSVSIAKGGK
ncbi:MAG: hypothetical protein V4510_06770 [bacterium]